MRTDKLLIERVSGEWESVRMPTIFSAIDTARALPHDEVWLWVPAGRYVFGYDRLGGPCKHEGPCYVYADHELADLTISADDPRKHRPAELWASIRTVRACFVSRSKIPA